MTQHRNLLILLFTIFVIGILWIALVPIFHTPDEQSHLGQVAFMLEKRRVPNSSDRYDLTEEIYISEKLLDTVRDNAGNNKFTFHPQYRLDYTDNLIGKYETNISDLATSDAKNTFVHSESTRYPVLYYVPAAIIYKFFYNQDIFTRIFFIRIWSLIIFIGTVYSTYKLGELIRPNEKLFPYILAILVGFQPMMMFANIGVSSDSLGNLLFTLFFLKGVRIIIKGANLRNVVLLIMITLLSIYTKPQFIIVLPIIFLLFLISGFQQIKNKKYYILTSIGLLIFILFILFQLRSGPSSIIIIFQNKLNLANLARFTLAYTLPHTIKEVMPWYWGIYDWLGVTYSRAVHRIINRIVFLALIGCLLSIKNVFSQKFWRKKENQALLFLFITAFLFFTAVSFYDWLSWYSSGYQLGVQGRYFFPLISIHMIILLLGWEKLLLLFIPRLRSLGLKILGVSMMLLNLIGVWTISKTYYDLSSFFTFISQASQYKPWFIKGFFLTYLLGISVIVCIYFLFRLFEEKIINKRNE